MLDMKKLLTKIAQGVEVRKCLWTNPSPTSNFTAQDVPLPNVYDVYDFLEVEYLYAKTESIDTGFKVMDRTPTHAQSTVSCIVYNTSWFCRHRARWWTVNGLHFDSSYYNDMVTSSNTGQSDANLIPYKIYGIRRITL